MVPGMSLGREEVSRPAGAARAPSRGAGVPGRLTSPAIAGTGDGGTGSSPAPRAAAARAELPPETKAAEGRAMISCRRINRENAKRVKNCFTTVFQMRHLHFSKK